MKPLHYEAVYRMLLERFGAPIVGDHQGVPTSSKKKDMGNRGFGADLSEDACCDQCGMMQGDLDQAHMCQCGMNEMYGSRSGAPKNDMGLTYEEWIAQVEEAADKAGNVVQYGRHSRFAWQGNEDPVDYALGRDPGMNEDDLVQKAPPGGEKVVKALKKQKGVKNPWAVAWAMKNRGEI